MTVYTYKATAKKDQAAVISRPVDSNTIVNPGVRLIAVTHAATGTGSTLDFNLRLPTSARVLPSSKLYNDDLGTNATVMKLGFKGVNSNASDVLDAISGSIALGTVSTVNTGMNVLGTTLSNYGKRVWELMSLASDPGGFVDVVGTTLTAATSVTGYVALDLNITFN